jgi:hypothetical protein
LISGPHLDVEEEHEHEREDGDALVVVRPRNAAGDVAGHDAHKGGGRQPRARALDLYVNKNRRCLSNGPRVVRTARSKGRRLEQLFLRVRLLLYAH